MDIAGQTHSIGKDRLPVAADRDVIGKARVAQRFAHGDAAKDQRLYAEETGIPRQVHLKLAAQGGAVEQDRFLR